MRTALTVLAALLVSVSLSAAEKLSDLEKKAKEVLGKRHIKGLPPYKAEMAILGKIMESKASEAAKRKQVQDFITRHDCMNKAVEDAIYHIERNGNAKIILLDLSMQLTRLLHKKEV